MAGHMPLWFFVGAAITVVLLVMAAVLLAYLFVRGRHNPPRGFDVMPARRGQSRE